MDSPRGSLKGMPMGFHGSIAQGVPRLATQVELHAQIRDDHLRARPVSAASKSQKTIPLPTAAPVRCMQELHRVVALGPR